MDTYYPHKIKSAFKTVIGWTNEEKVMLFPITYSRINNNNLKCIYKHIHCQLKFGGSKIFYKNAHGTIIGLTINHDKIPMVSITVAFHILIIIKTGFDYRNFNRAG